MLFIVFYFYWEVLIYSKFLIILEIVYVVIGKNRKVKIRRRLRFCLCKIIVEGGEKKGGREERMIGGKEENREIKKIGRKYFKSLKIVVFEWWGYNYLDFFIMFCVFYNDCVLF